MSMSKTISPQTNTRKTIINVTDAPARLKELQLDVQRLLMVVERVKSARSLVSKNSLSNAPGMKAYLEGAEALRDEFVGDYWESTNKDHLEGIYNAGLNLKILFQNVDVACDPNIEPIARSPKGAASQRACQGNQKNIDLPLSQYMEMPAPEELENLSEVYYLMIDQEGSAELSQPTIKSNQFDQFPKRIFIVKVNTNDDSLISSEPEVEIPMEEIERVYVTKK